MICHHTTVQQNLKLTNTQMLYRPLHNVHLLVTKNVWDSCEESLNYANYTKNKFQLAKKLILAILSVILDKCIRPFQGFMFSQISALVKPLAFCMMWDHSCALDILWSRNAVMPMKKIVGKAYTHGTWRHWNEILMQTYQK